MTGLVDLLLALQSPTPLTISGAGMFGGQAGHQCVDRHYFPSGARIPDHTPVLCQSHPELGGKLQRPRTHGERRPLGLQPLHKVRPSSLTVPQVSSFLCTSAFFLSLEDMRCLHQTIPRFSQQGRCLLTCCPALTESALPLGRSPPAAGARPWGPGRANQLAGLNSQSAG